MERVKTMNPFVERENYDRGTLAIYRATTVATWLLVIILGLVYTIEDPAGAVTIQAQNAAHSSPFALNPYLVGLYWIVLVLAQVTYIFSLFRSNSELLVRAANLGSHFIINNIFVSLSILLWVHGHFWFGEVFLALNYFNLASLYFKHSRMPFFAHYSVVVGPQMWTTLALFTNGAAAINACSFPARIVANVFIWSLLLYGLFFLGVFLDYVVGFVLTYLMAALAVQQFMIKPFSLQAIFALVIAIGLAVASVVTAILRYLRVWGNDSESGERRPLLDDE